MLICPVCSCSNPDGSRSCEQCNGSLQVEDTLIAARDPVERGNFSDAASHTGTEAESDDEFSPGDVIASRYEIDRVLGHGGMGAVYAVFDRELERTIALKAIRPELTGNSGVLRRLKQEVLLTRQIAHPNVVRVFDLGVAERLRFITMEFVDGDDLRVILDRMGKLSPKETVAIMKQLCSGLEAAHAEDVTHRDLKPRNILIGRDHRVRIADFGLARSLELTGLTRTGAIIGTPNYMAPEQAAGAGADARSDIFSLGVVFYEMLTGELPFSNRSVVDSFLSRTRDKARPITAVDPSLPEWLAGIVMRCLETSAGKRFQSAHELLDALDSGAPNAQAGEPFAASGQTAKSSGQPGEPPTGNLKPGTMLGSRYRVEELAGEGGMGKVYRATDLELERTVALKVVHPDLARNAQYLAKLKREISLASQISHRNVLRIHDLGEANGVRFVSMAWAEGEDLAHLIKRSRMVPERALVQIALEICEGLSAAHAQGVVHRDLKPSNILLDAAGHACVADFGVALGRTPIVGTGVKAPGELVGTPRYMSPEQAEGKTPDARSDLYSVGLIVHEMATGRIPFADDSIFQTLALRVSESPANPKSLNPALSDALCAVILRCLERDPEKRYATAQALLEDLKRLQSQSSDTAVPLEKPPAEKPKPKITVANMGLIAAGVAAVIAGSLWAYYAWRTPHSPAPADANAKYIAVLPFRSLSSDPNVKYEAEGIGDAITARLFSLNGAHPVSAQALDRVDLNLTESVLARQLGANLVVNGKVQSEGDRLQVFVNLDDVKNNRLMWSGSFDGMRQDLFTLEDEVATGIVSALKLAPTVAERERQPLPDTQNLPAYDLYLRGRDELKNQRNISGATQALKNFQQAVDKDREFALAWTGIADSSMLLYRISKDSTWAEKALLAAREAEQRNRNLPEVHFALGSVYSAMGRNAEAVDEIKHALQLAPNSDDGYIRLARAYLAAGQNEAAVKAAKKAVEMNPYYWYNHKQLGFVYQQAGRIPEALTEFKRQVELNPQDATGYTNIGAMYYLQGKLQESVPYFRKAIEIRPYFDAYANLGTIYYDLGQYADAIAMARKAVELNANSSVALRNLAQAYAAAGQQTNANAAYDRAIEAAYKALQVNPQNADELATLALSFGEKGDFAKAQQALARAREINPTNRDVLYEEAVLDAQGNKLPDALAALQRALENGASFREALNDPALAPVRRMPQFAALERRFSRSQ